MLTVFSWGYEGWGNATAELVRAFDVVEAERGYEPPVFVDIRVRRQVRAVGFREDTFERRLGRERHRWMRGLGNAAIDTGSGPMRLRAPADVHELLGLALAQQSQRRRVVFFCSCASPWSSGSCHRGLVRQGLVRAASRLGLPLTVQEWPGGPLASTAKESVKVEPQALATLQSGGQAVRLGSRMPPARLLGWAHGSLVALRSGGESQLVSLAPARLIAGEWRMPLFVQPVDSGDSRELLLGHARKLRRELRLEPMVAG
ncbi:hypothetical protein [Hyalangium sp.]|uniref:hypothetical protein n=1 Tax=Hyalangium sp. TaxID=2028555 RepID=UPI002D34E7E3|nr:hypothetical protein [Hyalangium sp.]HYH96394.1 hypothetical protein [Hyalangium sp.]